MPGGFKQPVRNVSSSDAEIGKFCNYVKLFFGFFHISRVCTVPDHLFWVRFGALEKFYVLLQLVCLRCGSRIDELPQNCFVMPSEGPSSVNHGDVIPETPGVSKLVLSICIDEL